MLEVSHKVNIWPKTQKVLNALKREGWTFKLVRNKVRSDELKNGELIDDAAGLYVTTPLISTPRKISCSIRYGYVFKQGRWYCPAYLTLWGPSDNGDFRQRSMDSIKHFKHWERNTIYWSRLEKAKKKLEDELWDNVNLKEFKLPK
jgi:hypothetical protein